MDNLDIMQQAIDKAKDELSRACHFIDCGANAGIRKMNSNKADWLKWLIYLAEKGLAEEKILAEQLEEVKEEDEDGGYTACKECSVSTEAKKLIDAKDAIIEDIKWLSMNHSRSRVDVAVYGSIDEFTNLYFKNVNTIEGLPYIKNTDVFKLCASYL